MPDTPANTAIDGLPDLECPGCGADLAWDDLFLSHRVCGTCRRHFFLSARERLALTLDEGSFEELDIVADGDEHSASGAQRLADSRERDVIHDAVVTGLGTIDGVPAVFAFLDEHATGTTLGAITTDKVMRAMDRAAARRLPFVTAVTGGNAATSAGPLSIVQPARLAVAGAELHMAGIPTISLICQAASADLVGALAGQADIVLAENGCRVWARRDTGLLAGADADTADALVAAGLADTVIDRAEVRRSLGSILGILAGRTAERPGTVLVNPSAGQIVDAMMRSRFDLAGDRVAGDDPSVAIGLGDRHGHPFVFAILDREHEPSHGIDARKVTRAVNLATRFELPLLLVIGRDLPSAPTAAEAMALAKLRGVLTATSVPIVSVALGDVRSMLGRAMVTGDRILAAPAMSFGVDGVASGPRRQPSGAWSRISAVEAQRLGFVDLVLPDDPVYTLGPAVGVAFDDLAVGGPRKRAADRKQRLRGIGRSTPEGLAALREEWNDWREWQANLTRSVEDWRDRWDHLRSSQPRLSIQRPDFGDLANRLRARRTELLERAGRGDRDAR